MRTLQQPGPVHPNRIDIVHGTARDVRYTLEPGRTLTDSVTAPLIAAGFQSATVVIKDAILSPFRFVMPGPPDSAAHVAYFSATEAPEGRVRIEQANATFGWSSGVPIIHVHAAWTESNGRRRGGHILPSETIVAEQAEAIAWGFPDIRIETASDPETNFSLLQPVVRPSAGTAFYARVKPNQDILSSVEEMTAAAGLSNAIIQGSLGSLIGAVFTDGEGFDDPATEVFVREGFVRDGKASLSLTAVDSRGQVRSGWLRRNENAVCITFDVFAMAAE
jgi:predicted DNA-binding protein with PD1-like motif